MQEVQEEQEQELPILAEGGLYRGPPTSRYASRFLYALSQVLLPPPRVQEQEQDQEEQEQEQQEQEEVLGLPAAVQEERRVWQQEGDAYYQNYQRNKQDPSNWKKQVSFDDFEEHERQLNNLV